MKITIIFRGLLRLGVYPHQVCATKQIPGHLVIIAFVPPSLLINSLLQRQRLLKIKYLHTDMQQTHHYKMWGEPEREHSQLGPSWPLNATEPGNGPPWKCTGGCWPLCRSSWVNSIPPQDWKPAPGKACSVRFFQQNWTKPFIAL